MLTLLAATNFKRIFGYCYKLPVTYTHSKASLSHFSHHPWFRLRSRAFSMASGSEAVTTQSRVPYDPWELPRLASDLKLSWPRSNLGTGLVY
jgi:hypothetical protein